VTERVPEWAETSQVIAYGVEHETTFYSRHGDWFAWLCLITSIATIARFRLRSVHRGIGHSQ
jgi:apolipoprotein N-acyltransferase